MTSLTYPEVGATRDAVLPAGYRHVRYRADVGAQDRFRVAAEAILTWRLHRAAGVPMRASAVRAAPGVRAASSIGVGRLRVSGPCEVVWAVDEATEAGFGYGTLVGHPVRGEEAFVARSVDGRVWFSVTAFSRPATWYAVAAGPLLPLLQRAYARHLARVLRRLCAKDPRTPTHP